MAAIDKAAAFLSQLKGLPQSMGPVVSQFNPAMQTGGANIAQFGANILQQGANVLADAGDAAYKRSQMSGRERSPVEILKASLPNVSNALHAGSQNLLNMGPGAQTALGYGAAGAGALAAGAAAAAVMRAHKDKKERMAGQNLGAQLGVQMPGVY
jgi:hypothetical protein